MAVLSPEAVAIAARTIRVLTVDACNEAGIGHAGLPLGCAELGTVLFGEVLAHDPARPDWPDRDRFVLSAGHGSMLLYSLLHMSGYAVSADDLRRFHSGEAVLARPVSPWRRAARWVGRHKLPSVAALASLVALAAWGVVGLQVARRERNELRLAVERYQHVRDILGSTDYRLNPLLAHTCEEYDPGDPSGHIFYALHYLQSLAWSQAAERLDAAIGRLRAVLEG